MKNIKPRTRLIVAIVMLCLMVQSGTYSPYPQCFIAAGIWGIAFLAWVFFGLKYKYEPPTKQEPQPHAAPEASSAASPADDPGPRWEDVHGSFVTHVAGVTFKNEDGTERQRILKDLYVNGADGELQLKPYTYKGADAVAVLVNGDCIGNLPKYRIKEYEDIADRIERARVDVSVFTPDEDLEDEYVKPDRIYRADLTIVYKK